MADFKSALSKSDLILIAPIYGAGEDNAKSLQQDDVVQAIVNSNYVSAVSDIEPYLQKGDVLLFMGAGHITKWAHDLLKRI
jgi:UDP-N-acetylmuramate-alanine ligase